MNTLIKEEMTLAYLEDDLILRRSTPEDAQALAELNAKLQSDDGPHLPDKKVAAWVRDLLEKPHPTFGAGDFTVVEERHSGRIVSSMNLISQTWSYGGIRFGVGRPELVCTLPEYRQRGLVRAQFEVVHRWSAERGEAVQAITGIPYYYRQFGYEMAMDVDTGRFGYKMHVPNLENGQKEPYTIRPAEEADLAFIADLYEESCRRSLVSCVRDEVDWKYELSGKNPANVNRLEWRMIETAGGKVVGYLAHPFFNGPKGADLVAWAYEIVQGYSWAEITPTVIRYLATTGESYAKQAGKVFDSFGFWLGRQHPVYEVLNERAPRLRRPYSWYVRVPDLPGFIRLILPVLEERLSESAYAGHTGELKLTFYRSGLRLDFERGRLVDVKAWKPEPHGHSGDVAFPNLTFLQLLFGYRSLDELAYAFPDCWWEQDDAYGLVKALFPKQASHVWGVT